MPVAADSTLGDARGVYFAENGLPDDGGYEDAWVVIRAGGLPVFAFPNGASRREAVPMHDLHHVLTGYGTDWVGEAEIGAWELASDCSSSPAATVLNLLAFGLVLPFHFGRLRRAFARGLQSRNLYGRVHDGQLLARTVGEMRRELEIPEPTLRTELADAEACWHWRRWVVLGMAVAWGTLLLVAAAIVGFVG